MSFRPFGDSPFYVGHGLLSKKRPDTILCLVRKLEIMKLPVNDFGEITLIVGKANLPTDTSVVTHFVGGVNGREQKEKEQKWLMKGDIKDIDRVLNNPFDKIGEFKK